ncbi:putative f-box domain protein [Favolaschia claudopus]|uniref:F-box domain protein n=1 Tax=Favolaschia claudopus TaxID=2862362 RepID=A0AAW0DD69_9AGAR
MKSKSEFEPGPPPSGTRPTRASTRRKQAWEFGCTAAPGASVVMSTPELLELILVDVPLRDLLLVAPLVCKIWCATTKTPTIQRLLFFLPDPSVPGTDKIFNPFLQKEFPPFFEVPGEGSCGWCRLSFWDLKSMPWFRKRAKAFKYAEASWRRMYITQPPTQRMLVLDIKHSEEHLAHDGYDLTLPLVDTGYNVRLRWNKRLKPGERRHNLGHKKSSEGYELTLSLNKQDSAALNLVKKIGSDSAEEVEIEFTEWENTK